MKIIVSLKKRYPWIFWTVLATPIIAWIAIAPMLSENYPSPFLLKLLFPYIFYFVIFFRIEEFLAIGFFLYVFYGIILTLAEKKGKLKETKRIILITHIAIAAICIAFL